MRILVARPVWILVGVLALVLVAAVVSDRGILHLWRLRAEVETLRGEVQALTQENERLARDVEDLQVNPAVIERIAREELGLVRPGERVLRFPRSDRPAAPSVPGRAVPPGTP